VFEVSLPHRHARSMELSVFSRVVLQESCVGRRSGYSSVSLGRLRRNSLCHAMGDAEPVSRLRRSISTGTDVASGDRS
jgi:hypothetical protein